MQEINFWFSIGSTYTYLTVKRLRTKINDLNLKINFHPFSVRTVMKDMDNIPFPPSKKPPPIIIISFIRVFILGSL